MIKIPDYYERNIVGMFGEAGKEWLAKVPKIIKKYIELHENEFLNRFINRRR